jgi:hypothetical protein
LQTSGCLAPHDAGWGQHRIPVRVLARPEEDHVHIVDTADENKASLREHEVTEEKFFEQFAVIEESLALLQLQIRDMSENVKLFSSLAMHIRRSVCPAGSGTRSDMTN